MSFPLLYLLFSPNHRHDSSHRRSPMCVNNRDCVLPICVLCITTNVIGYLRPLTHSRRNLLNTFYGHNRRSTISLDEIFCQEDQTLFANCQQDPDLYLNEIFVVPYINRPVFVYVSSRFFTLVWMLYTNYFHFQSKHKTNGQDVTRRRRSRRSESSPASCIFVSLERKLAYCSRLRCCAGSNVRWL